MNTRTLLRIFVFGLLFDGSFPEPSAADDWPMYRKNAGRTAVSNSELPENLKLIWQRQLPAIAPAFHSERLQFDAGYEPVAAKGKVLVGSSLTDSVTAYDADTGRQAWVFRTNGPVRCAPAIHKDRVCFGSDDGFLYCVNLETGSLHWKHQAAPSDRRLLGNQRLISVWPVRGGPVVSEGIVYFAAGVWPFEGVFVYAMEIATGRVVWRNDRMGYLFGQQPHNTEAIGGLAPQGYLLIDGDKLVVPCSTAFPAKLDLATGELVEFKLPGPGRLPGGWFSQLDTDTARAIRRGTIAFDDVVNQQQHEDKVHKAAGGVPGLSRQIRAGKTDWKFDNGFQSVDGKIHSMIVADDHVYVVTRDGAFSCFSAGSPKQIPAKLWPSDIVPLHFSDEAKRQADRLLGWADNNRGLAFVIGIKDGGLVKALIESSQYHVVAFDKDPNRIRQLRSELTAAGAHGKRAAVIECDTETLVLPPYLATLLTTESRVSKPHRFLQSARPFGGIAAIGRLSREAIDSESPGKFQSETHGGQSIVRRVGPIPGAQQYSGDWAENEDALVRFPLGVLWFDDSLAHFKRSPQPQFLDGLMLSRPKDWRAPRIKGNNKIDYPLLPFVLSDIYTGRVLDDDERGELRTTLPKSDPSNYQPSQYRPPRQTNAWKPDQPVAGQRTNPLTGLQEPRAFPKTYGCDGGVDYGLFYTLRSGTPAYYDKTIESGTVFLSGPRSGCTNSIIPSGGVLNVPYFYEGCTCSYPLPSAMSLVSMPQRFEQWASWGEMEIKPESIQRIGVNFGAPGDRMTRDGVLWLDHPSVGGPSPSVRIETTGNQVDYRYRHSMWMSDNDQQPWVTASMAEGLEDIVLHDLKPGKYAVHLYFAEPDDIHSGERVQDVVIQGQTDLKSLDIVETAGESMTGTVFAFTDIEVEDTVKVKLTAIEGRTLISGIKLVRQPNPKIKFNTDSLDKDGLCRLGDAKRKSYEFCIPDEPAAKKAIQTIDPGIQFHKGSHGRIDCDPKSQILCIGETKTNWQSVLDQIADLNYVREIHECFLD